MLQSSRLCLLPAESLCCLPWALTCLSREPLFLSQRCARISYQFQGHLEPPPPTWVHWIDPDCLNLWQKWYPTSHCPLPSLSTSHFPFFTLHLSPPLPTSTPPAKSCPTPHLACPDGPRAEALIEPAKGRFHGRHFNHIVTSSLHLLPASQLSGKSPGQDPAHQGLSAAKGIPQAPGADEPHTHGHSLQGVLSTPWHSFCLLSQFQLQVKIRGRKPDGPDGPICRVGTEMHM